MFFKDRNNRQEGILAKSRKQISKAGRLLMALAVGGCLWGQGEVGFAEDATNNQVVVADNNYSVNGTTTYYDGTADVVHGGRVSTHAIGTKDIIGGSAVSGDASNNVVTINGGTITGAAAGTAYYIDLEKETSNTENNILTINGGNIGSAWGGQTATVSSNNTVNINGGTIGYINGGTTQSSVGLATGNKVNINGGTISSYVIGGAGYYGGAANKNEVVVTNGTIKGNIWGGFTSLGVNDATRNPGEATENTVTISGGTVDDSVFGAEVNGSADATNNTVIIYGGTLHDIYGAWTGGNASGNTIHIYNSPNLEASTLHGAVSTSGTSSNNSLNIHTKDLVAKGISDFDNINFFLPSTITNGDTVLTLTNGITNLTGTTIRAGVEGNANLSTGDTVTLIKNSNGITTDSTTTYGTLSEGVSLDYNLTVEKADATSIVAKVGNVAPGAGSDSSTAGNTASSATGSSSGGSALKEQTNILPKPLLSSSFLTLQGTDRIIDWLPPEDPVLNETDSETKQDEEEGETAKAESPNDFQIFANMGFNRLRTKTGGNSYADNNSGGFDLGAARTLENSAGKLVFAPIVDYGKGSYDCYSDNGMHGSGNSKYWAGGMIARQMNRNGFYYEASFRAGRASVDFVSDDFLQGGIPTTVSYDVSAPVFAGHVRVGQLYQMGGGHQLHLYGIYSHNHQNGMTAHLSTGETYNFNAVDSGRLRIGARLTWMKKRTQKFYSGIAYQYEYSNGATGSYRGYSTESSNMRGSSAMIELGWQVKPTEQSPWMVDVGATGWVGHQKGFTVQAKLMKSF